MNDTPATVLLARLSAVEQQLARHAARDAGSMRGHLTDADASTGEQWEWGQVWAHLAEFLPYWLAEVRTVVRAYNGDPVPFGRVKSDPLRVAAIERDRNTVVQELWTRTREGIEQVRLFLQDAPRDAWTACGVHRTLGVMQLDRIVDEFMVGHLEQHSAQLDGLARAERG